MFDITFNNGKIIDGKGNKIERKNIAIKDGIIAEISDNELHGKENYDISGLYLCPGFIDVHTHSDIRVLSKPTEKLYQGVTTEVIGNCGFSAFQLPNLDMDLISKFVSPIFLGMVTKENILKIEDYLSYIEGNISNSVSILLGHGNLRFVLGEHQKKELSDSEINKLTSILDEVLSIRGVKGMSLGLEYPPGSFSGIKELISLCKILEKHNSIIAIHLRNYYDQLIPSVEEALSLARQTGVSVQISHLQNCDYEMNPDGIQRALEIIGNANEKEGLNVHCDMYPYLAGSSVLTYFLPDYVLQDGKEHMLKLLQNKVSRQEIIMKMKNWQFINWDKTFINFIPSGDQKVIGKNFSALADKFKKTPEEVLFDTLIKENGEGTFIKFDKSEEDLIETLKSKYSLLVSDSIWSGQKSHPRLYGSFIRFLKRYVIDKNIMSLEEAIAKCTFLSAKKFNLSNVGCIEKGRIADITILDLNSLEDRSTFENPAQKPLGVINVIQGGEFAIKNNIITNTSLGRVVE